MKNNFFLEICFSNLSRLIENGLTKIMNPNTNTCYAFKYDLTHLKCCVHDDTNQRQTAHAVHTKVVPHHVQALHKGHVKIKVS